MARRILAEVPVKRIATQIEPDGSQPQELLRTRSFHYSMFNLEALIKLAAMGQVVHVDLWHYKSPKGGSIRKALDWMVPYAVDGKTWQHQQITKSEPDKIFPLLRLAAIAYHSQDYERMADKLAKADPASPINLMYPAATNTGSYTKNTNFDKAKYEELKTQEAVKKGVDEASPKKDQSKANSENTGLKATLKGSGKITFKVKDGSTASIGDVQIISVKDGVLIIEKNGKKRSFLLSQVLSFTPDNK